MGHWYTQEGLACHYQENGKDTTLRHARKQGLVPSVTGILDILDKPGLTNYIINRTIDAAWEAKDIPCALSEYSAFSKTIRDKSGEHSKNARDKGSSIHKALEDYANGIEPVEHKDIVKRVTEAIRDKFSDKANNLVPECTFSHRIGYGGAVDLSSPELILDYKYKSDGLSKKMVYDSHIGQLTAYRYGLGYHEAKCGNVFISDTDVEIVMIPEKDLEWGLDYFQLLLALWKHTKRYNSGF